MAPETSPKDPEFVELVENPPGGPLRQARQTLNFGQLDVARRLNLTVDVINALEENRFSDLPEATYVKGYLRSYARFLEIDSDPLIKAYEQLVQPEHGSALSSSAKGDSAQRAAVRWASLAIAAVVLVMFVSWWVNVQPPTPEATMREEMQTVEATQIESPESEAPLTEPPGPIPEAATVADGADEEVTPPSIADEDTMHTEEAAAEEPGPREAEQATTESEVSSGITTQPQSLQTVSTAPQDPAVEATPTAVSEESASASIDVTIPGEDQLTMVFSAQSWTEVYDAQEQRLLFDLVKSGSVRNLQGMAPFNVRLGNSSGVQISINGQPFNHSQFSRQDNTARFSVDRPSPD